MTWVGGQRGWSVGTGRKTQLPKIEPRDPVAGGSTTGAAVTLTVTANVAGFPTPLSAVIVNGNDPAALGVPVKAPVRTLDSGDTDLGAPVCRDN
jgi:hypothetical protein